MQISPLAQSILDEDENEDVLSPLAQSIMEDDTGEAVSEPLETAETVAPEDVRLLAPSGNVIPESPQFDAGQMQIEGLRTPEQIEQSGYTMETPLEGVSMESRYPDEMLTQLQRSNRGAESPRFLEGTNFVNRALAVGGLTMADNIHNAAKILNEQLGSNLKVSDDEQDFEYTDPDGYTRRIPYNLEGISSQDLAELAPGLGIDLALTSASGGLGATRFLRHINSPKLRKLTEIVAPGLLAGAIEDEARRNLSVALGSEEGYSAMDNFFSAIGGAAGDIGFQAAGKGVAIGKDIIKDMSDLYVNPKVAKDLKWVLDDLRTPSVAYLFDKHPEYAQKLVVAAMSGTGEMRKLQKAFGAQGKKISLSPAMLAVDSRNEVKQLFKRYGDGRIEKASDKLAEAHIVLYDTLGKYLGDMDKIGEKQFGPAMKGSSSRLATDLKRARASAGDDIAEAVRQADKAGEKVDIYPIIQSANKFKDPDPAEVDYTSKAVDQTLDLLVPKSVKEKIHDLAENTKLVKDRIEEIDKEFKGVVEGTSELGYERASVMQQRLRELREERLVLDEKLVDNKEAIRDAYNISFSSAHAKLKNISSGAEIEEAVKIGATDILINLRKQLAKNPDLREANRLYSRALDAETMLENSTINGVLNDKSLNRDILTKAIFQSGGEEAKLALDLLKMVNPKLADSIVANRLRQKVGLAGIKTKKKDVSVEDAYQVTKRLRNIMSNTSDNMEDVTIRDWIQSSPDQHNLIKELAGLGEVSRYLGAIGGEAQTHRDQVKELFEEGAGAVSSIVKGGAGSRGQQVNVLASIFDYINSQKSEKERRLLHDSINVIINARSGVLQALQRKLTKQIQKREKTENLVKTLKVASGFNSKSIRSVMRATTATGTANYFNEPGGGLHFLQGLRD